MRTRSRPTSGATANVNTDVSTIKKPTRRMPGGLFYVRAT
jgi:hypothetical protein